MMTRRVPTLMCLLSLLFGMPAIAQKPVAQQLDSLFKVAEQCYIMDDYQQLLNCINRYYDVYTTHSYELGNSTGVFGAYYYKMLGAYYYGLADNSYIYTYRSEQNYRMSLDILNRRVSGSRISSMHPDALVLHQELAQLYYKAKLYRSAKEQLDTVSVYFEAKVKMGIESLRPDYYKTMSQLAMCNARLKLFDTALSQIGEAINYFKKRKDADYYEALRRRGKILMLQADNAGTTNYKEAVKVYEQYVNERYAAIGREMNGMSDSQREQHWLATHQFLFDCYRLGNRAPKMLYDLALFSKDYLVRRDATVTKWEQVRRALGKKDCALEFVQYFGRSDQKRLGCLVLRKDSKQPEFIDLFATDSLLALSLGTYDVGSAIMATSHDSKDTLYKDQRLSHAIWSERLMAAIGNAENIYFAPDGMLHQLAIEYIMPDSGKVCRRLSSTRILTQKRSKPKLASALLCGGMEFRAPYTPKDHDNDVQAYRYLSPRANIINDLPGTKKEVDSVYAYRHQPQDTLLIGKGATDNAFLELLGNGYQIVHLATHGFFGGNMGIHTDIKPLLGDESMSRSGVLFTGVVNTLSSDDFDETQSDGALSAAELSKQDFSKTELVVLSACQTGLGRLTDDGIYGMQRGLKKAGANAMILALWNVNDQATYRLMSFFYQELEQQKEKDLYVALMNARQRLKNEEYTYASFDAETLTMRLQTIKFDNPHYLNPFILIDAY